MDYRSDLFRSPSDVQPVVSGDSRLVTPPGYEATVPKDREIGVRDYVAALRRHVRMIFAIALIITAPVALLMMNQPDYYDAKARVEVETSAAVPAAGETIAVPTNPADFNTQLQYLTSPALLREVIRKLDLEHDPAYMRHVSVGGRLLRRLLRLTSLRPPDVDSTGSVISSDLSPSITEPELKEARRLQPLVADLSRRLTVAPVMETRSVVKDTRLVDLTFRHPNPLVAAKLANAVADIFVAARLRAKNAGSLYLEAHLKRRAEELQDQIRTDEQRFASFGDAHRMLPLEAGEDIAVDRLTILNRQLLEAENDRKLAEASYNSAIAPQAAKAMAENDTRGVLNEATMKLADLRAKRAQMLVGATDAWPEVKELDQQIKSLENDVRHIEERGVTSALASLETKFRQAQARELAVRSAFESQRTLVQSQNRAAGDGRLIRQRIEINKTLLTDTLKNLSMSDASDAARTSDYRVIEYSSVPDPAEPVGPLRSVYISIALLLSMVTGAIAAVVLEAFDEKLRSSADVEAVLQTREPISLVRSAFRGGGNGLKNPSPLPFLASPSASPELLLSSSCPNDFIEDYRHLRTALLYSNGSRAPKTILVTSSVANEGVTTNAVNLALSLAQTGANVLLIDANLREPRLHQIFSRPNRQGFSSWLSGTLTDAAMLGMIQPDLAAGLNLLPAGQSSERWTELLSSDRILHLLDLVETRFTHVVLDAPPIGTSADSAILAPVVDVVLLVVRAEVTPRDTVRQAHRRLGSAGAKVIRVVLNSFPDRSPETKPASKAGFGPAGFGSAGHFRSARTETRAEGIGGAND